MMDNFQDKRSKGNGRWSKSEHQKFLVGLELYGKNWKKIQQLVPTRTGSQIRSHAQKYFLKFKNNGQGQQNSEMGHQVSDYGEPLTVISKTIPEALESENSYSYFMEKIIKYSSNRHHLDLWGLFFDGKSNREDLKRETERKNSCLTFEGINDQKMETPLSCLNVSGVPIV